jgi:hypothetical protein
MFNQNDLNTYLQRQRDLQREARQHNLAKQARTYRVRQSGKDSRRWARVLSLFL